MVMEVVCQEVDRQPPSFPWRRGVMHLEHQVVMTNGVFSVGMRHRVEDESVLEVHS